jgi:hypothetical protein
MNVSVKIRKNGELAKMGRSGCFPHPLRADVPTDLLAENKNKRKIWNRHQVKYSRIQTLAHTTPGSILTLRYFFAHRTLCVCINGEKKQYRCHNKKSEKYFAVHEFKGKK